MAARVGINGFGRIGRQVLRSLRRYHPDVEVVAVNDLADTTSNAHLFKWDSSYGRYEGTVEARDDRMIIDGREIVVFAERDPGAIPWSSVDGRTGYRVDRAFHESRPGAGPHERRSEENNHLGSRHGRGRHLGPRGKRCGVRRRQTRHHLQRVVHDQLRRARGQGAER